MNPVEIVGWSLVNSLWQGAAIAAGLFVLLRVVDPRRATLRYSFSIVSIALLLIVPTLTAFGIPGRADVSEPVTESRTGPKETGDIPLVAAPPRVSSEARNSKHSGDAPAVTATKPHQVGNREVAEPQSGVTDPTAPPRVPPATTLDAKVRLRLQSAFPYLVAFWLAGVLLLSLRLVGAWVRAQRLRTGGTTTVTFAFEEVLQHLIARLGVLRPVRLLQSSRIQVPAVIGWLRPVVLIPASLASGLTLQQVEAILAHELAHVRRHDYLVNLLQAVIETLLFYHPAAWWISRQVRQEREHCCDDLAVRVCGNPQLYAGTLLTLEEHRVAVLLPAATGGDLLARVRRLVAPPLSHAETSPRWVAGLIGLATILTLGGGAGLVDAGGEPRSESAEYRAPALGSRNAPMVPDTVIRHPDPSAPLASRWEWARQTSRTNRYQVYWIGYTIEPMAGLDGSVYIGRLERKGITGGGGLNLRGRISSFGGFDGFTIPGVPLAPLIGGGMPDDVALLFAFVLDDRGRPVLARVHISSLALPVDLEDRPLLWLGSGDDEASILLVQSLYAAAPTDLKRDVVAAVGVHGNTRAVVPHLSAWLESGEPEDARKESAEWLGRHPDREALSILARAARTDRARGVRGEAAEAVGEMRFPAATDTLIALARTLSDREARKEAVEGLAEKSEPKAREAAVEIARSDSDIDVRREAVETLGEFPGGAGVRQLIELARSDRSTDVRMEAVETIAEAAAPDEALRVLRQILSDEKNSEVQREAVESLGDIEDPGVPALLRELIRTHPSADVRSEAIETLAEIASGPETAQFLGRVARDDRDRDVQHEAIESLGEMDEPGALELVTEVAKNHPSGEMRVKAVETLARALEPAQALPELRAIVRGDRNSDVQVEAVESLGELPADMAIPALIEIARAHPNEDVRAEAVETLGEQGPDKRISEMLGELARSNAPERVVMEAIETLGEMQDSDAMAIVVELAESRASTEARKEAVETIGESAEPELALRTLVRIARANDNVEVQREAVETIGETQHGAGIAELVSIARTHPRAEVRMEALETLAEIGAEPEVLEVLAAVATGDASFEVQEEALESLAELPDGAGVPVLIRLVRDHPNRELRGKALEYLGESDDPRAKEAIDRILQ